jgi:biopolymer transport protein ExbB/TolQ
VRLCDGGSSSDLVRFLLGPHPAGTPRARAAGPACPKPSGGCCLRTALAALNRFRATRSIQDASSTAREVCSAESDRLDSELAMIRYIAWAIPSIGFIGTVRGIGDALTMAHRAVQGDISGVTEALGVAFNSTFVALLLSLLLMFVLHQLQLRQERQVLDTESYVDERLLANLQA